jgi:hypothetical protein
MTTYDQMPNAGSARNPMSGQVSGPPWRDSLDLEMVLQFFRFRMICGNCQVNEALGQGFGFQQPAFALNFPEY